MYQVRTAKRTTTFESWPDAMHAFCLAGGYEAGALIYRVDGNALELWQRNQTDIGFSTVACAAAVEEGPGRWA
jgi:hypothetical protein